MYWIICYSRQLSSMIIEPRHDKTNKMSVRPAKTQIRLVWSESSLSAWISYPLSAQRRLWSDWANAQADLSLRWAHTHFVVLSCRGSYFTIPCFTQPFLHFQLNCSLEKLNLAWNGLHWQGARALASGLRVNNSLTDLDVQCNRMSEECLAELLKGLKQNTALEILRVTHLSFRRGVTYLHLANQNHKHIIV